MSFPAEWPADMRTFLEREWGTPTSVERLGGMSLGVVYRVRFPTHSAIVKHGRRGAEWFVYTVLRDTFDAYGIEIPRVEWSGRHNNDYWLVLEDIPNPLPRERWLADDALLTLLARLHSLSGVELAEMPDRFRPGWDDALIDDALRCFNSEIAAAIEPLLHTTRQQAKHLFKPSDQQQLISGDPNPANWGLRDDGTLVLYDWERLTYSPAAIDLAITVPGLGDAAAFRQVAERYAQLAHSEVNPERLADDIRLAKLWTVIEFLAANARRMMRASVDIAPLVAVVPDWFQQTCHPN